MAPWTPRFVDVKFGRFVISWIWEGGIPARLLDTIPRDAPRGWVVGCRFDGVLESWLQRQSDRMRYSFGYYEISSNLGHRKGDVNKFALTLPRLRPPHPFPGHLATIRVTRYIANENPANRFILSRRLPLGATLNVSAPDSHHNGPHRVVERVSGTAY